MTIKSNFVLIILVGYYLLPLLLLHHLILVIFFMNSTKIIYWNCQKWLILTLLTRSLT
ncbi:hypothetical protein DsansV1_C17g0143241 [Dioscorea sansibarensis]